MRKANQNRIYKIMFTRQKNGSFTTRMSIPWEDLKDIGVEVKNPHVKLERVENGILIKKLED